jgi:type IV pilus assembly protein PilO
VAIFGMDFKGKSPAYGAAVGLVLGGILAGIFYWQFVIPKQKDLKAKQTELAALQVKIQEGKAAEQKLQQFRDEVRRLELELDKLLRILPARRNTGELIRRVRGLAEQGDFDLQIFKPGKQTPKDFYTEWPIQVVMAGNYHNLALFFDRISRFRRIINIDKLKLEPVKDNLQSDTRTITASFEAKTFVYVQPEEEAEASTATGAATAGAAPASGATAGQGSR